MAVGNRAFAFARRLTASEVAYQILDRRLALSDDDRHDMGDADQGSA